VKDLTIGEVFDFKEGAIFHFAKKFDQSTYWFNIETKTKWNILKRYDSTSKNKVSYQIARKIAKSKYKGSKEEGNLRKVFEYKNDTTIRSYNNLDSSIKTRNGLFETPRDTHTKLDTIVGTTLCDTPFVGLNKIQERMDGESHTYQFSKGLGRTYYNHFNSESGSSSETTMKLVYYEDNSGSCGNKLWRLSSTNLRINKKPQTIKIIPNPASDQTTIQLPEESWQSSTVRVYDMNGKQMLSLKANQPNITLDISQLRHGLYLFRVENNGEHYTRKLQVAPQ